MFPSLVPSFQTTTFLLLSSFSSLLVFAEFAGDDACWLDGIPRNFCCDNQYREAGTPSCWTPGFRYARCCGVKQRGPKYVPSSRRSIKLSTPCDYIVVGAGSGGGTLASRLETAFRTCVVEVTTDPKDQWTNGFPVKDWKYMFGQGLGGSTLVNSGVFTRGNLDDYEEWGGEEYWSVNRTRELFKSIESPSSAPGLVSDGAVRGDKWWEWHPARSPPGVKSSPATLVSPEKEELPAVFRRIAEKWEEGGLGRYRVDPHSDKDMEGLGGVWRFVGCADEMDAACTPQRVPRWRYIGHEREHQSVDHLLVKPKVYVGTVTKVLLDEEKRARGVEFVDNKGQIFQLEARKEVILAAGVVNTPKILMLSGIGDPLELEELGVPLLHESPSVGLHLQDHYGFSSVVTTNLACPKEAHRDEEGKPKGGTHLGFLNDFVAQFYGWYRIPDSRVTFEMFLIEGCLEEKYTLTFTILLVSPSNEGRIILDSADPLKPARMEIHPHEHEEDINYLAYGLQLLYSRVVLPGLRQYGISLTPDVETVNDRKKLQSWIRDNLYYYSHPTGTARLDVGRYDESVVGKDLLVQGIPNLRICDASVIGKSVVGHSDAPTRMVGANCAKMIFDGQNAEMPYSGYGTNLPLKAFHIQYYLQAGGRLIDTAASYQNEQVVAVGMGQSEIAREKIFLVTKIGPETFDDTYTAVKSHLEKFQGDDKYGKFQKVTYFDLVLLHWPNLYSKDLKTPECAQEGWESCRRKAWQGLEKLVAEGVTRFVGVSNFAVKHLDQLVYWDARKYPIYANQIEYHPFRTEAWEATKKYCDAKGIRVMGYGAMGGLKREMYVQHDAVKNSPLMQQKNKAGASYTAEEVMVQWSLNQGVTVLQGSKRKRHMDTFMALTPGHEWVLDGDVPTAERDKAYQPDAAEVE